MAVLALVGAATITFAAAASTGAINACVNNNSGAIHVVGANDTCSANEMLLSWNQQGLQGATGPQGPAGPQGATGAPGPQGEAGSVAAFYSVNRDPQLIPNSMSPLHQMNLPVGKYVITSSVLLNNLAPRSTYIPVVCSLQGGTSSSSVTNGIALEPLGPTNAFASTLANTYATEFVVPGIVELRCASNTGPGGAQANAESIQITAIQVSSITRP